MALQVQPCLLGLGGGNELGDFAPLEPGTGNQTVIVQIGTDNRASSTQDGVRETSVIVQQGSGNTVTVIQ